MAVTVKQTEALPSTYPPVDMTGWSVVSALNTSAVWQRVEAHIVHRFTPRAVEWVVEGPGEWCPPLRPTTITTAEIWNGSAWESIALSDSPLGGFWLSGAGPYKFSGTVGGGDLPNAVLEAFKRLCEYLSQKKPDLGAGVRSRSFGLGGDLSETLSIDRDWTATAIDTSGAGDLLRQYRRAL